MRIVAQEIPLRDSFGYLGPMINKNRQIEEDVKYSVKSRLLKQRRTCAVPCDQSMPTRLNGRIFFIFIFFEQYLDRL